MDTHHTSPYRWWLYLVFAAVVVVLDQLSKVWVLESIPFHARWPVVAGFFDLTHVYNPGAAFSFLADAGGWQKYLFTGFAVLVTLYLSWNIKQNQLGKLGNWAAAMIIGGALGNVIDRLAYGYVADFLNMSCCGIENPYAFNLADVFIFAGAIGLVLFTGKGQTGKVTRKAR